MNKSLQRCALLLSLLVSLTAHGQNDATAPQYAEEIEVRAIDVDVVVTDRLGNPITNLTRDQFQLYEDGKPVEITYFSRVVDGRVAEVAEENARAPRRIPLTWVVFIDHTNVPPQTRNLVMRQLQLFLRRAVSRGDRGVIALNDGRSFRIRQGLTDDPRLLMEALAKMEKERMSVSPTKNRANAILAQIRRTETEAGVIPSDARYVARDETPYMALTSGNEISAIIEEEASRTKASILALGALLDTMAHVEGRLALVYVGAGFNTLPGADLAAIWRSRYGALGPQSYEPRPEELREPIEREIARLYDDLSAHRVAVYTIHGGEQSGAPTSVEDGGQNDHAVATSSDFVPVTETSRALEMSKRTGGLFFKVHESLSTQLQAVVRDLDNYYSIGYRPAGRPTVARRIEVRVKAAGARVRHRETVRERTRAEKAAGAVVAAAIQPPPPPRGGQKVQQRAPVLPTSVVTAANPLGVSVEADRPKLDGWGRDHIVEFNFSIGLDALTFVKFNDVHRAAFVTHFALVGKDGAVYPLESREQSLAVPASEFSSAPGAAVSYSWHVDLAPLRIPEDVPARQEGMRLTITVEDRGSGTRSVVTVPLGRKHENRG